jgi:cell division protein FtsW (lipid II flippase)
VPTVVSSAVPAVLPRTVALKWPSIAESLLTLLAIVALLPLFAPLASLEGRHGRYATPAVVTGATAAIDPVRAHAAKNDAMRALLPTAGAQWASAMLAALGLLKLARTRMPAVAGAGLAMLVWAAAAWAARVPWPFAAEHALILGRAGEEWDAPPAPFVVALAALGFAALAVGFAARGRTVRPRQTLASRIGFPGFVVATGIGAVLLLDLSAHGPPTNRYLALYHHGHLWLALLVFTVTAFLRPVLGRALAALLAIVEELAGRIGERLGLPLASTALALVVVAIVAATGALLAGVRQFTSELGRLWLIGGVAWFFYLRGTPVAERLARAGPPAASLLRYAWPLAFVAVVLAGAMLVTRDMGPLLIASYAAGAFLAASIAMWWHVRRGAIVASALLAGGLFVAWIVGVTHAVFTLGALDEVTAGRLENLAAPLASANDQLALVTWFRDAVPPGGFGPGAVPWCGFAATSGCAGVPAQIQSDYTFTALVGVFGHAAAWIFTLACALWLHRIVARHADVTRGEPRFVRVGGRLVADAQAFLSWIGVAWVVLTLCQLAVTVAGNLAVLPLTGVTFPFVSFGMTSLVVNAALLALCVTVDVPEAAHA